VKVSLYTDGGARGNPGPAGIGVVIKNKGGQTIKEIGKFIGNTTNNEAEYRALIEGLVACLDKTISEVGCYSDSKLVVNQLNGDFKVKNAKIRTFYKEVKRLERNFDKVTYTYIPRDKNTEADSLVNEVLDSLD